MSKPNIILIICDQMRGDCLGIERHPCIKTPNLDYLASHGTRFSSAYSAVPSCLPARAILWSGQNQWHTGVLGMGKGQGPIPNDFPYTLPGVLTAGGYRTHMVGKGHFTPQRSLMGFQSTEIDESGRCSPHGFEDDYRRWFYSSAPKDLSPDDHGVDWNSWLARPWHTDERLHPSAWTMNQSIAFLRTHNHSQPFFLNISFARPHSPYVPPKHYWDLYKDTDIPEPAIGEWAAMHEDPVEALNPNAWRGKIGREDILNARRGYYGEISFIDAQIGRLLNFMRRYCPDSLANTWFVFTSDHGDMMGDHNLWRKTYAYEGSSRIPFLVVPPQSAFSQISICEKIVELRDIMPTILSVAGMDTPVTVDGQSVLPLMLEQSPTWREYIHGEHCTCYSPEQEMQYVTDGKRKFIWLPKIGVEQFFDLTVDPLEKYNLLSLETKQEEIALWRLRLIHELEDRNCGWVKNNSLFCPDGVLTSPYKNAHFYPGATKIVR